MNDIEQIIKEQLKIAPAEVRKYLSDGQWAKATDTVASRYGLSPVQTEALKNEVLYVFLGIELRSNLVQNIESSLGVPKPIANGIFQSVSDRMLKQFTQFLPTEEELEEISQGGKGLIEDAKGNADNNTETTNEESRMKSVNATPAATPEAEYKMTEGEPMILKEKFVPPNLPTGKETPFEKKIASQPSDGGSRIIKQMYSSGQDPYREPLN